MPEIRTATPADVPILRRMILELAEYERLAHAAQATDDDLQAALFGPRPAAECVLCCIDDEPEPAGFALFFTTFSTFVGKPGIYLEDLYVRQSHRGRGLGKSLLLHVAQLARERGCGRVEWSVLDWNEPSIAFYRSLGAVPMDEWTTYRLDAAALARLSER